MMYTNALLALFLGAGPVLSYPNQQTKREVSPDFSCGGDKGYTCPGSASCCSQWGWCGASAEYCDDGCQPDFGTCDGGGSDGGGDGGGDPTQGSGGGDPTQGSGGAEPTQISGGGGDVRNVARPKIGSVPYGSIITDCVNAGDIALTFDDGPSFFTTSLLDLLARYNVKATFFVVGSPAGAIDEIPEFSNTIRRAYDDGHQIAGHTWSHPFLTTLSSTQRREEMYRTEAALVNILGVFPTYMRPPYLDFDAATGRDMADLGYHVVSTNLDTGDWANATPATVSISQDTFDESIAADPGSTSYIVLNHDRIQTTVEILAEFEIKRLQEEGYRPVTVGDCLNDPASNWYRSA